MISKDISLRALEVFEVVARTGSVARSAEELGLSLPAVSQQLRNLETSVGRPLLDHSRRPMALTAAGQTFQKRTTELMRLLRQALTEASVLELSHVGQLRLGVIDDFDNHVAVAASPEGGIGGLVEYPLLSDPFLLIVPRGFVLDRAHPALSLTSLPFLRYDRNQMIGRQIEARLRRLRLELPNRFELGSNPAINALVANGGGWAVTTALSYMRSERFHDRIDVHPLPFAAFSRTISLFSSANWIPGAAAELAGTVRRLLSGGFVGPTRERFPWIADQVQVLDES
jgi:DNA-binding transcriptional LysR family regulator